MRDEGIRTGIEREMREEQFATVRNLLPDNIVHADIARWTALPPDEINRLAAEMG